MKHILTLTLLLFFYSCSDMEMVVELDIPPHEPLLVLNGVLDADTNVNILLTHSLGAFEQGAFSQVEGAQVALFKEDVFVANLYTDTTHPVMYNYYDDSGIDSISLYAYSASYKPTVHANYRIEASHPDYPFVSASTYIPQDIELYNVLIDSLSNPDYIRVSFSFNDDPSQENYYRVIALGNCSKSWVNEYDEEEEYGVEGPIELFSNDPSLESDGIPFDAYTLFTDVLFDGQEKNMSFDMPTDILKWGDCDTIALHFTVFSEDSYSYFNTLSAHASQGQTGIFGGEITPVYSNVEGGLGVLISANTQNLFLKP